MKLELRGITKRFGSLVANHNVNLTVEPGEIHCLLGENGAGKTTLMNVLFGLVTMNEGQILVDDEPVSILEPKHAVEHRIGMVHQHFMLVPVFTVAENVVLGFEPVRPWPVLDHAQRRSGSCATPRDATASTSTRTPLVENLPIGMQQRAEILKALDRDAEVLILDEPTAVLTPQETESLFAVMRRAQVAGQVDRLHHAQAEGGAGDRRPHHRHAAR